MTSTLTQTRRARRVSAIGASTLVACALATGVTPSALAQDAAPVPTITCPQQTPNILGGAVKLTCNNNGEVGLTVNYRDLIAKAPTDPSAQALLGMLNTAGVTDKPGTTGTSPITLTEGAKPPAATDAIRFLESQPWFTSLPQPVRDFLTNATQTFNGRIPTLTDFMSGLDFSSPEAFQKSFIDKLNKLVSEVLNPGAPGSTTTPTTPTTTNPAPSETAKPTTTTKPGETTTPTTPTTAPGTGNSKIKSMTLTITYEDGRTETYDVVPKDQSGTKPGESTGTPGTATGTATKEPSASQNPTTTKAPEQSDSRVPSSVTLDKGKGGSTDTTGAADAGKNTDSSSQSGEGVTLVPRTASAPAAAPAQARNAAVTDTAPPANNQAQAEPAPAAPAQQQRSYKQANVAPAPQPVAQQEALPVTGVSGAGWILGAATAFGLAAIGLFLYRRKVES